MDMTLVVMAAGLGSRYGGVKQIERLGPDAANPHRSTHRKLTRD